MNIIGGIICLALLIGLVVAAASSQKEENERLTKRFYNEIEDLK